MMITNVEPILTGGSVFLKVETDAGIVGYGDAMNNFIPYSSEGMLKDLVPYLVGEDPERIEYLWQVCFHRRFYRGGPATGAAIPFSHRTQAVEHSRKPAIKNTTPFVPILDRVSLA